MDVRFAYQAPQRAGPSLPRGSLFYRSQLATRLIREGAWSLARRVVVAAAVTGAPLVVLSLSACEHVVPHDSKSLLFPHFERSEVIGLVAGFGTTFAALPDLFEMLKRRSTAGMNPSMSAIMGTFQILWVYYGLLIVSRPVVVWNLIGVVINFLSVGAYFHFKAKKKTIVQKT
jgi:MtN3 and saliva related transmembrane protein